MNACCKEHNPACYWGGHCPERDKIERWSVIKWVLLVVAIVLLWLAIKA